MIYLMMKKNKFSKILLLDNEFKTFFKLIY